MASEGDERRVDGGPAGELSRSRHIVAVCVLVLLNAVLAGLYSASGPTTYAAQADLLYDGGETSPAEDADRELATQQVLLTNRAQVEKAASTVGLRSRRLAEQVSVELVGASSVLRLRVEDTDQDRALAAAQALVTGYQAAVTAAAAAADTTTAERSLLKARIEELRARLAAVQGRVAAIAAVAVPPAPLQSEARQLENEAGALRQQIAALQLEVTNADVRGLQQRTARVRVLTPPFVLDEPVGPQPLRAAAAGVLVGVVLAVALVTALHVLRGRRARSSA